MMRCKRVCYPPISGAQMERMETQWYEMEFEGWESGKVMPLSTPKLPRVSRLLIVTSHVTQCPPSRIYSSSERQSRLQSKTFFFFSNSADHQQLQGSWPEHSLPGSWLLQSTNQPLTRGIGLETPVAKGALKIENNLR